MAPLSQERIQRVAFVRHGVARHNLLDPATGKRPNLKDPSLFDPPLVFGGKKQALEAGERLQTWWHTTQLGETVDLVITSPLTRCIQSSVAAFLPGDNYSDCPKLVCLENVREAYGMDYPDRRRNKSLIMKHWPMIHFDPEMPEEDPLWKPDERETLVHLEARVTRFLRWLARRPERNIVVFSHGVWIETCFRTHDPDALGPHRVHNCDCYAGDLVSSSIDGTFSRLQHFRKI